MAVDDRDDPYLVFNFLVEFGSEAIGCSEVTGLQIETVVETYREGGLNTHERKLAGPTRYPSNLVLKRGLTDADFLWGWYESVQPGAFFRRTGAIYLLDGEGKRRWKWEITDAYPVKWAGPDFRADSNSVAFESLELVHRGIKGPSRVK